MAAATDTSPLTASVFLFPERQDVGQALAEALDSHGVLRSRDLAARLTTQVVRQAAEHQVGVVADGLLNLDLGDLVIAGWRKQAELADAAERTATNPGTSQVVKLATHRISSVHRPYVELLLNEQHLTNVNFELDIEFVVTALAVTVRDGHVVSLHAGDCDVSAALAAEGIRLASRQTHLELPLVVRWPLRLRLGGGSDPLPSGAKSPPAPPPPPTPSAWPALPPGPSPIGHAYHRRRRRPPGTPAD
jgi:hypothetical protein